jgi:lipopolysaccharide transport system ATP-binding protein
MSHPTVISVENLGKAYRISHQVERQRYIALRDVLADRLKGIFRPRSGAPVISPATEDFWALKDVSFEVKQGEIVGIIGRNGAGKSTLLKILSRITEPTEGRVRIKGRVASLLEVGTGFHPELTGRENIFLNGSILGMSRAEIKTKFDEIVAFAEVERFLDTPVKHYSSGMYVRLAFAVAANLEPEILIVDEVLAVGDAEFQKKCLGKMQEVTQGGRTVLFVSHNMSAVQSLCHRGILLKQGMLAFQGNAENAVGRYLDSAAAQTDKFEVRHLSPHLSLTRMETSPPVVRCHDGIDFILELQASADEVISDLMLEIYSLGGQVVAIVDLRSPDGPYRLRSGTKLSIRGRVTTLPLVEADFNVTLYINANSVCRSFLNLVSFSVLPGDPVGGVVPRETRFRGFVELRKIIEATVD